MQDIKKIPQVSNFITPLLIILLIISAFIIGVLWTKVQYLEKPSPKQANLPSQPAVAGTTTGNIRPITDIDHVRGDKNAKVTLVEYSDLECPFCKSFHPTMKQALKEYEGEIRWVYRHFPLSSIHANAQKEAEASECAAELGGNDKFWEFIDAVFERTTSNGRGFALDNLPKLAQELGLSKPQFEDCLNSDKFAQKVKDEIADGQTGGITGTPGTIVIDAKGEARLIPGALPYEQVKQVIEEALEN